jgi:formylglycine-generating enzyme required for sulfatase activity
MPDIDTQGGPVFEGDFSGTYIGGDQIIAIQGYNGKQLALILGELRKMFATGQAALQASLAQARLQVAAPGFPTVILSEQAANDLLPLAARQEEIEAYLTAQVVNPRFGCWSSQYVELVGALVAPAPPGGWMGDLKPEYFLYELERGQAGGQVRRVRLEDITQAMARHPALVLLGEPGCGKTTTLERLVLQKAMERLASEGAKIPLLLPLGDFRDQASPYDFVYNLWQRQVGKLDLSERLRAGQVLLLFDALNEMPFADLRQYRRKLNDLYKFVAEDWPGNQAVFTCRSRDYAELLGLPQVEIERLSDERVGLFLQKRLPAGLAAHAWERLRGSPLLELVRNPYYLNMLARQIVEGGAWPQGRASLFRGFVGTLLKREKLRNHPGWVGEAALERALVRLAAYMQPQGTGTRLPRPQAEAALRMPDAILDRELEQEAPLDPGLAIKFGLDATLLDVEPGPDDLEQVRFFHHQLQEFFAAHALLARFRAGQAMDPYWRQPMTAEEMPSPGELKPFEPMPLPPPTGWEEPTVMAAGLAGDPQLKVDRGQFLIDLAAINPVLAARCLLEPGVAAPPELADETRQALLEGMTNRRYHRRARLAYGLALGELGDPRFAAVEIEGAKVALPPLVHIPGGKFKMGSSAWQVFWLRRRFGYDASDERHQYWVRVDPFWLGRYPVTNAEFRCFWQDGGYDQERYWQTPAARAWRSGQEMEVGPVQEWLGVWQFGHDQPAEALDRMRKAGVPAQGLKVWQRIFSLDEDQAQEYFRKSYGERDRSRPAFWEDSRYNNPSQPVVGVTWYEALAYCAWLEEILRRLAENGKNLDRSPGGLPGELLDGLRAKRLAVRLPGEAEWECAARGAGQRVYPWGNRFDSERSNTSEGELNRTSPVGMYPGGACKI